MDILFHMIDVLWRFNTTKVVKWQWSQLVISEFNVYTITLAARKYIILLLWLSY